MAAIVISFSLEFNEIEWKREIYLIVNYSLFSIVNRVQLRIRREFLEVTLTRTDCIRTFLSDIRILYFFIQKIGVISKNRILSEIVN